jgi:mannose-6-phosphate isomerase-like protein (cupin superfamily)
MELPVNYVFDTTNRKQYRFPTHINELVVDRAECTMAEAFIVIVEPGKAVHRHAHATYEQLFYIIDGEGVLTIGPDSEEYIVLPTQLVRIPVGTLHSMRPNGNQPLRYLSIDCFGGKRDDGEPIWEDHVKTICTEQGWDYAKVVDGNSPAQESSTIAIGDGVIMRQSRKSKKAQ